MNLTDIQRLAIDPALSLLPPVMDSPEARLLLLAICGQEANFKHRVQVLDGGRRGPAHGLLMFEKGGGVRGVMEHAATRAAAASMCARLSVAFDRAEIWRAIEFQDVLAFGFGRLLLWSDPQPLPVVGAVEAAWRLYALRTWKPGKPHRATWEGYYRAAHESLIVAPPTVAPDLSDTVWDPDLK